MNNLLLPDLFAMAILLCVLGLVRRRYPQHDIRLWMGGLLLIFLECTARILYGVPLPELWHRVVHAIALDAYLLAGVMFLQSTIPALERVPGLPLFTAVNSLPGVMLMTEYGWGRTHPAVYLATGFAGLIAAVSSSLWQQRPPAVLYVGAALWLPVLGALAAGQPRLAVYLLLAGLYLAIAGTFFWSMDRGSAGKLLVVIGFGVWGLCFATHPWIASGHPTWVSLFSEIWNMQKFLITTGFLMSMFERQVQSNEWIALHDQLTGLPNRWLFHDRLGHAIARAERDRTSLLLFCLDLNFFKEVNDTLGHDAGDALLSSIARNLQQVVRRTDTLARIGGDEFVLLATDVKGPQPALRRTRRWRRAGEMVASSTQPGASAGLPAGSSAVLHLVDRLQQEIRAAVARPVHVQGASGARTVQASVSIGVALYPTDTADAAELFRVADQRMYEDKRRQHGARSLDRVLSLLGSN